VEEHERLSGKQVIRLHVGEPYFTPPVEAIEALARSARDHRTSYTSAEGLLELREALVHKLNEKNRIPATVDRVFVSPGSTQGLVAILLATADPGAEILLPEIHWPIYLQQSLLAGLRPSFYRLKPDFRISPDAVLSAASPRTRILLINSPANPTGAILDQALLSTLLSLARKHNWIVISDEAYEDFIYDGVHVSIASLEEGLPENERRVFSVFTFSKSYAMTGYRLGYVVAPNAEAARALQVTQEASIIAPSTPVQFAALAALGSYETVRSAAQSLRAVRDSALPALLDEGLLVALPQGGWYVLLDLSSYDITAERFAEPLLRESGVAVSPASRFSVRARTTDQKGALTLSANPRFRSFIRVAFCGPANEVAEGFKRIRESLGTLNVKERDESYAA